MNPEIQWHTATPLWPLALEDSDRRRFQQPALLRFASDDFMDEMGNVLSSGQPEALSGYVARRETWRSPAAGWAASGSFDPNEPLKLYQPAHLRYYLVAASLVCRVPGLPDKIVDTANDEKTTFVLRRIISTQSDGEILATEPDSYEEYAWLPGSGWASVSVPETITPAEERLPLFPMSYGENGHTRRLLVGFVPAASRESFQAAPQLAESANPLSFDPGELTSQDELADPRLAQFTARVTQALYLLERAINPPSGNPPPPTAERAREVYGFALLDWMLFLEEHLDAVFQAVRSEAASLSGTGSSLFAVMRSIVGLGLLNQIYDQKNAILLGQLDDGDLPDELSILESLTVANIGSTIGLLPIDFSLPPQPGPPAAGTLEAMTGGALPAQSAGSTPASEADFETRAPKLDPRDGSLYMIRFVYEKPACKGTVKPVVSAPSPPFQLASFFDAEAPARPIRITMPVDTTIAGLREAPKNVSFLLSDELRKQVERVQGIALGDLDEGTIGAEPSINLGMICSLSIPIITICALLLLMIIVQLLNIVFWWLPFFKICLPIGLKANPAD